MIGQWTLEVHRLLVQSVQYYSSTNPANTLTRHDSIVPMNAIQWLRVSL